MPSSATAAFLDRLDRALDADGVFTSREARDIALEQFSWDEGEIFSLLRPMTDEGRIWIRLCERQYMIVVSFHRG